MAKIKKIAWHEIFHMYVYVNFKVGDEVVEKLKSAGFMAHKWETATTDWEITVAVEPSTAHKAHEIIKSIIT